MTHFLEGVLCACVAARAALPPLHWLAYGTLVGGGATVPLFARLRIAHPAITTLACIAAFALVLCVAFQAFF